MTAQRDTRTGELLARLDSLSPQDRDNEILLKVLERDARKLIAIRAQDAYTLLGAIAAIRQDVCAVKALHEKALNLAPNVPYILRDYAVSLERVGELDDAIRMARRAWESDRSQIDNLCLVIELIATTGRIQEAAAQLREAKHELLSKLPPNEAEYATSLEESASFLEECAVSDEIASKITTTALKITSPISVKRIESRVTGDDENMWVDFAVVHEGNLETITDLNVKLAEQLAELSLVSDVARASSAFVVRFTSIPNSSDGCNSN